VKRVLSVVRVSSGDLLEMCDYLVFGYDAIATGRIFFPASSGFAAARGRVGPCSPISGVGGACTTRRRAG
jgi:hypothetical protein